MTIVLCNMWYCIGADHDFFSNQRCEGGGVDKEISREKAYVNVRVNIQKL